MLHVKHTKLLNLWKNQSRTPPKIIGETRTENHAMVTHIESQGCLPLNTSLLILIQFAA